MIEKKDYSSPLNVAVSASDTGHQYERVLRKRGQEEIELGAVNWN